MATSAVNVKDLTVLRKAFKATGTDAFDRYMAKALQQIAQQVIDADKPKLSAVSHHTADATRAQKSSTAARIVVSRADAPMAGGVIFGAYHNQWRHGPKRKFHGYNQFRPWPGGPYHFWPELDEGDLRDKIAADFQTAVDDFFGSQGVRR